MYFMFFFFTKIKFTFSGACFHPSALPLWVEENYDEYFGGLILPTISRLHKGWDEDN